MDVCIQNFAEQRRNAQKNEIPIYFGRPKMRNVSGGDTFHAAGERQETTFSGKNCVFVKDKSAKKNKEKSPRCETNGNYHTYCSCLAENQSGTYLHPIRSRQAPEKPKTRLYWFSSQIEACGHTFSNKILSVKKQRR